MNRWYNAMTQTFEEETDAPAGEPTDPAEDDTVEYFTSFDGGDADE